MSGKVMYNRWQMAKIAEDCVLAHIEAEEALRHGNVESLDAHTADREEHWQALVAMVKAKPEPEDDDE